MAYSTFNTRIENSVCQTSLTDPKFFTSTEGKFVKIRTSTSSKCFFIKVFTYGN